LCCCCFFLNEAYILIHTEKYVLYFKSSHMKQLPPLNNSIRVLASLLNILKISTAAFTVVKQLMLW
jgi:hypothetical protein